MKHLFSILLGLILFTSCSTSTSNPTTLFSLIPENAEVIIKTSSLERFTSGVKNNDLLKAVSKYKQIKTLEQQLDIINYLNPDSDLLLCLSNIKSDSLEFSIISKYNKNILHLDSLPTHTLEKLSSKKNSINKLTINSQVLFTTINDSIFFASNNKKLVESSFTKNKTNLELEKIYKTAHADASLSILLNSKQSKNPSLFFKDSILSSTPFTNYTLIDTNISQNKVILNGITKATDSLKSLINIFEHTVPQNNQISAVCPPDVDYAMSFTFNDFKVLNKHLITFNASDTLSSTTTELFNNITEVGILTKAKRHAAFLNSIDALSTQETLEDQNLVESFRGVDIFLFEDQSLFKTYFRPLISFDNASQYIVLDNYFVFSNDTVLLKDIIAHYQNKTTLSNSTHYQTLMQSLSDESSLFIYSNDSNLNSLLNQQFSEDISLKLKNYKAWAVQFIYDNNYAHINGVLEKHKIKTSNNSVTEELNIQFDTHLLSAPQFVVNHTNKQKDIVVQDINNNLYLISNTGKVYWKKQLDGKILGQIKQIDSYKNGRLQLVFATPKRLYVLDRKGNDVGRFPLTFNDEITQPLSVFDYDKKKNYRLLLTQGKSLLMLDHKGKKVNGFKHKSTSAAISSQPKHFRIGRKDYIVFSQGKKLEILNRTGKTRINVKTPINFSNNGIYLYKNKFTTTNNKGELIQVNTNGQLNSSRLMLNSKHTITSTSKTLVSLSENKLKIKSKVRELEYGEYSTPKLFYINNKIYVTLTNLELKKIHVFDSQAQQLANFPVYGNSAIDLNNIDKDPQLEFVTKGDSKSIILYQIN